MFLWVVCENGGIHIHVDVGEEAPTIKGFLSILIEAFGGSKPEELAEAPSDLLNQLGLSELIRMTRAVGLSAIIGRIKREGARFTEKEIVTQSHKE